MSYFNITLCIYVYLHGVLAVSLHAVTDSQCLFYLCVYEFG